MPAPYSDNLYSALSDSEAEDNSHDTTHDDALSPTDGYFHAQNSSPSHSHETPHVPNVLVEDPTLGARAKEEAEEARYNTQPGVNRGSVEGESTSHQIPREHASSSRPVIQPIPAEAPPAYSPRSPISPTSTYSGVGYQTFGPPASSSPTSPHAHSMGVPEEQNRLLPREPESMGGDPAPERPGLSRWEAYREEWKNAKWGTTRRKVRTVLSTLLIIAIFASFLGAIVSSGADSSKDKMKTPKHGSEDYLEWNPYKQCHHDPDPAHHYRTVANYEFIPGNNVSIFQKIDDDDAHIPHGTTPHISGNVILKPGDHMSEGRMELELLSNHKDLTVQVDTNQLEQRLVVKTPRSVEWYEEGDPCIQIRIIVFVPVESTLESLEVEVVHLDIDILEDLDLTLESNVLLTSVSGHIAAPDSYTLSSREIWVETVSGGITGTYPLYDLLGLHTVSGTIATAITPEVAAFSDPKPAKLDVASVSGSLSVKELYNTQAPPRDYVVQFRTTSGTIDAEVAVSSKGVFRSQSASMSLRIWPFLVEGQEMELDTETKSGTTEVEVLEPTWLKNSQLSGSPSTSPNNRDDPFLIIHPHSTTSPDFGTLRSRHASISTSINLRYPSSWTGEFEAHTVSGSQKFRGEGLRTGKVWGMFPRVLRGRKGDGEGRLRVDSVSGSQDFLVGRE